jgi:hypothetical protein
VSTLELRSALVVSKKGGVAEVGNHEQEKRQHVRGGRALHPYLERQSTSLRHALLRIALNIKDDGANDELKRNICCAMRLKSRRHRTYGFTHRLRKFGSTFGM